MHQPSQLIKLSLKFLTKINKPPLFLHRIPTVPPVYNTSTRASGIGLSSTGPPLIELSRARVFSSRFISFTKC